MWSSTLARAQGVRSSAFLVSRISRVALASPGLYRFNTCAVGILRQLRAIERSAVERTTHHRMHKKPVIELTTLWSSANEPAIERIHAIDSTLKLSMNNTLMFSFLFYVGKRLGDSLRRPQWPKTSLFFIVNTPKRHFLIDYFYFLSIMFPFNMGG